MAMGIIPWKTRQNQAKMFADYILTEINVTHR